MTKATNVSEGPAPQKPNRSARRAAEAGGKTQAPVVVAGITVITDSNGRKIGLRKLTPGERFELDDAIEAKTLSAGMTIKLAASVISIGDEATTPITNRAELHERLDELGDEGLAAITEPGLKLYGVDLSELEKAAAKN